MIFQLSIIPLLIGSLTAAVGDRIYLVDPIGPFSIASLGPYLFPVLLAEALAFYLLQIRDQGADRLEFAGDFCYLLIANIPVILFGIFFLPDIARHSDGQVRSSLGSFFVLWVLSVAIKYAVLRTWNRKGDLGFHQILIPLAISNVVSYAVLAAMLLYLPFLPLKDYYKDGQYYAKRDQTHYAKRDQKQLALSSFDDAARLDPNDARIYYERGQVYAALGQTQRAIKDFDEAIRLNPNDADAYQDRGLAYQALGKTEQAQHDFDRAKKLRAAK